MKLLEVKNSIFSGYFRADKITGVWVEEGKGWWKECYQVMIRVDREDYLFNHFATEAQALGAVDKIREQMG